MKADGFMLFRNFGIVRVIMVTIVRAVTMVCTRNKNI